MKKSLIALAVFVSLNANGMNSELREEQGATRGDAVEMVTLEPAVAERQNPLQIDNNMENISYAYLNNLTDEELSKKFTRLYHIYGFRGAGVVINCLDLALNSYVAGDLLIPDKKENDTEKEGACGIIEEAVEGNNKLGGKICVVAAVINGASIINA